MAEDTELQLDMVSPDLINRMIRESSEHPDRVRFLSEQKRCWRYYNEHNGFYQIIDGRDVLITEAMTKGAFNFENRIYKNINDGGSIVLKNNPIVRHYPHTERPQDGDLANQMDDILASAWRPDGGNFANILHTHEQEAMVSGLGVVKIFWNPANQLNGDGQVEGIKVTHKDLFIDPYATNDHRLLDPMYIIHRTKHSQLYIVNRYGVRGEIALGLRESEDIETGAKPNGRWGRVIDYAKEKIDQFTQKTTSDNDPNRQVEPTIDVYEAWIFTNIMSDSDLVSGKPVETLDIKYGIVVTMINDTIVRVRKNPYASMSDPIIDPEALNTNIEIKGERHEIGCKRHPFVPLYWQTTSDNNGRNGVYCCKGAVIPQIAPQATYNSLCVQIYKNAKTLANGALVEVEGALTTPSTSRVMEEGGTIFTEKPQWAGRGIRAIQGTQMPAYVENTMMAKQASMQDLSGVTALLTTMGDKGLSHVTGKAIEGVQEAAFGPLYTPISELSWAIYDYSIIIEGLMQQWYKEDRFINISDRGRRHFLKWQKAFLTTNFIRQVVSGSTTPMEDVGKMNAVAGVGGAVNEALASGNPAIMENTIIILQNMGKSWTFDFIQLLQKEIAKMEAMKQDKRQLGQQMMAQQAGQGQQPDQQGDPNQQSQPMSEGMAQGQQGSNESEARLNALLSELGANLG